MDTTTRTWIFAFSVLFLSWVTLFVKNTDLSDKVKSTVYTVCDYSRQVNSGQAEQACGLAQDAGQAKYLCRDRNSSKDNKCWVELK